MQVLAHIRFLTILFVLVLIASCVGDPGLINPVDPPVEPEPPEEPEPVDPPDDPKPENGDAPPPETPPQDPVEDPDEHEPPQTPPQGPSPGPSPPPPTPEPPEPVTLTITANVAYASVVLDGEVVAKTDREGLATLETLPGTRTLRLEKDGYLPFEESIGVSTTKEHPVVLERVSYDPSFSSYVWVGEPGRQFNDAEFAGIAEYDLLVIEKFHAQWDYTVHFEAAVEAKNRNPDILVLPYRSATYRFFNDRFGLDTFNETWYLYDLDGEPVPFVPAQNRDTGEPNAYYVDLSNPDYRAWVIEGVLDWNMRAPYDGIAFDNAVFFAYDDWNRQFWNNRIGSEKVDAWNEGLLLLLEEAKGALGEDKIVLYNGISRRERTVERNLAQAEIADATLNEVFCVGHGLRRGEIPNVWSVDELIEDIDLMLTFTDTMLLQKTNYDRNVKGDERNRFSRFCLGLYAMGHVPGQTYYKYGHGYNARFEEITANAQGIDVEFGAPTAEYVYEGGILIREYEGGVILVNPMSPDDEGVGARGVELDFDVRVLYEPDEPEYYRGDEILVEPHEALFAERI